MSGFVFLIYTLILLFGWAKLILTNQSLATDPKIGGSVMVFIIYMFSLLALTKL